MASAANSAPGRKTVNRKLKVIKAAIMANAHARNRQIPSIRIEVSEKYNLEFGCLRYAHARKRKGFAHSISLHR